MKTIEEILKEVDEKIEKPLIDARFGDKWKVHMMAQYNDNMIEVESIITIAWKQGRRAILLERELAKYVQERTKDCYPKAFIFWLSDKNFDYSKQKYYQDSVDGMREFTLNELFKHWESLNEK